MNQAISYSELRTKLKLFLDKVCSEHIPLLVKRRNGEDVVIISKQDYSSMEETAYLFCSPENTKRLLEAVNRKSEERLKFDNIESVKNEIGI